MSKIRRMIKIKLNNAIQIMDIKRNLASNVCFAKRCVPRNVLSAVMPATSNGRKNNSYVLPSLAYPHGMWL